MPEISRFFGIIIRMFFDEHPPPHFHAVYGESQAEIGIQPIRVLKGSLPARVRSLVFEWAAIHQQELLDNWQRLGRNEAGIRIPPLE